MASTEGSRWTFAQTFLTEFQASRLDLETRIQQASQSGQSSRQVLDDLNLQLAQLSKSIVDATGSIPNYDQRNCETVIDHSPARVPLPNSLTQQLKELDNALEELRKVSIPVSKFTFKKKAKNLAYVQADFAAPPTVASSAVPTSVQITLNLSSLSKQFVTSGDLPDPATVSPELRSELSITDMDSCILNLLDSKQYEISALHIRNVRNSVLLLPTLEGSVILHDLSNCVVVVKCHQFRMHTSKEIDVHLSIRSDPIIEHCSSIRFAPYPSIPSPDSQQTFDIHVKDFSHIKSTPSPNWSSMSGENRKLAERWQSITNKPSVEVEEVLSPLLPLHESR